MALMVRDIRATGSDEALFELLSAELHRLLPEAVQQDRDLYHRTLDNLPRGLRAMAGIHAFDVSMCMDSLAWHFGNQNDERDLRETLNSLRELELTEIAEMFEQMWGFMNPYMSTLRSEDFGGKDFADWLVEIGAENFAREKDKYIWAFCKEHSDYGLLSSWLTYARNYPERCVVSEVN